MRTIKTVGEIKKYAESLPMLDGRALAGELVRLKNGGVPFLGCVCFVQHNRKAGLLEARNILLAADVYSEREKIGYRSDVAGDACRSERKRLVRYDKAA